jgi:hypothetical protein
MYWLTILIEILKKIYNFKEWGYKMINQQDENYEIIKILYSIKHKLNIEPQLSNLMECLKIECKKHRVN